MITDTQIIVALAVGFIFGFLPALIYMAYVNRMLNDFIGIVKNPPFAEVEDDEPDIYSYPDPDYWKKGEKPFGDPQ